MSELSKTIPKHYELKPALDFYRLRREGIAFIEQMGSSLWTDYNIHDPGITILEALCYALTDIAYRAGWDVNDLLTPEPNKPFSKQPFFTAREILTVNPWTPDDFRRLLIDLESVRNAWIFCKKCACDVSYYTWCEKDQLKLSYQKPEPQRSLQTKKVEPKGLYDVLLELEADPELGDLNDHKIEYATAVSDKDGVKHPVTIELRFPKQSIENSDEWELFQNDSADFTVTKMRLGATKTFDVFTDPSLKTDNERDEYIRRHWRGIFYLDLEIQSSTRHFTMENVTMRLFSGTAVRKALTAAYMKVLFIDDNVGNVVIRRYRDKTRRAKKSIASAKAALHSHRNLDEDYCKVRVINLEDVAVCADVEVKPDVDIEWVQARIWFEIERYFNPPVPFYTLQELMDAGVPVEEIFNGPELNSGFMKGKDLDAASLKSVLRVSDIINLLMDIDGVIAVNQLQLVKYDAEGHMVKGAADPSWSSDGKPIFDANITSASWLLYISDQHQPRLYMNGSHFFFYKNGLPFRPRMDEARDTLTQLRGEAERPKIKSASKDLPVPTGKYRNPDDYFPVQYSFPLTYGIGTDGLPSHASDERKAQAKQLKAYLMVFEQVLGNALAQLAHTVDLFSIDTGVTRTYFVKEFRETLIKGFDEIKKDLDKKAVEDIAETSLEFQERRNRFLDHLMARFGEQFGEYALLLTNLEGQQVALKDLIEDKIAFLNVYPLISHNRAKAFDYTKPPASDDVPALKKRIGLLLGRPGLRFIVVEHLLLRPKFPGDALYPICSDGPCNTCGDEDPYSFRLTFLMPGWIEPFKTNMEMRDFADRTIRQEMPAHLLGKICWVDNDGFVENLCDPIIGELAELLERDGKTAGGERPSGTDACVCATNIYTTFSKVFREGYENKTLDDVHPDLLKKTLETEFDIKINPNTISCTALLDPLWAEIQAKMVEHFQGVALNGCQFDRFEDAWNRWLEANAKIDWMEERLHERVEAILAKKLVSVSDTQESTEEALCKCAAAILTQCGTEFHTWFENNFTAGRTPDEFTPAFELSDVPLCKSLTFNDWNSVVQEIKFMLKDRYDKYKEVSYRLRVVVDLLGRLSNRYPAATLHDYDEGNDQNPVRLGKTALGD
ncbi:MAG: hypothetical protein B6D34_01030 [Candidatus Brocadia sp. UTAMX1]|jgi:hypothetical protein|nr:MAG: hypothetical protein B6D34_01030 [Candidatus Brocadia sp. UTAMX1]